MYIFDHKYDAKMKELIFSEYKMNKYIYGQMIYVIDDDYRHNII